MFAVGRERGRKLEMIASHLQVICMFFGFRRKGGFTFFFFFFGIALRDGWLHGSRSGGHFGDGRIFMDERVIWKKSYSALCVSSG